MRLLQLFVMMIVVSGCPSRPDAGAPGPKGAEAMEAPHVAFDNPPRSAPLKDLTIKVKASNMNTLEYSYILVNAVSDCKNVHYGSWRSIGLPIRLSKEKLGSIGNKTVCAKGKGKDNTEQKEPTSWGIEITATGEDKTGKGETEGEEPVSGDDEEETTEGEEPVGADDEEETTEGEEPVGVDDEEETTEGEEPVGADEGGNGDTSGGGSTSTGPSMASSTAAGPVVSTGSPREPPNCDDHKTFGETIPLTTTDDLGINPNFLKFASASKDPQAITLQNNNSSSNLRWSVKTTYNKDVLLQIRTASKEDEAQDEGDPWQDIVMGSSSDVAIISGNLAKNATQHLQVRLADQYRTDYGCDNDNKVELTIRDGRYSETVSLHILVPFLQIEPTSSDGINKDGGAPVWRVNFSAGATEEATKSLTISDDRGDDAKVLDWDVYPYKWKPSWLTYKKNTEGNKLELTVTSCPSGSVATLIIASNSDNVGVKPRSFALYHSSHRLHDEQMWRPRWREEGDASIEKTADVMWNTEDIRYVVVSCGS